jgi:hypothetical protein
MSDPVAALMASALVDNSHAKAHRAISDVKSLIALRTGINPRYPLSLHPTSPRSIAYSAHVVKGKETDGSEPQRETPSRVLCTGLLRSVEKERFACALEVKAKAVRIISPGEGARNRHPTLNDDNPKR